MPETPYALDKRTFAFAASVRTSLREFEWDPISWSDVQQLIRSSGSVAANYIEANESLSPKDFIYRIQICRKEAKESALWIKLIAETNPHLPNTLRNTFRTQHQEATELVKIFQTIINKKRSQS